MALVKLISGQGIELSAEKGAAIWQVMQGELEGSKEQQAFCATVQNVYLNRYNSDLPMSYIQARQHIWRQMDASKPLPTARKDWE